MSFAVVLALMLAAPPAERNPIITRPDWIEKPSGDDVNVHYPDRAMTENVGGRVNLRCLVQETGYLTGCWVETEDPEGYDFGAAALGLSTKFRMKPQTADGVPVRGAQVRIPMRFDPAEEDAGEAADSDMPGLELSLACYGHFAARADKDPASAEDRAHATIYAVAVTLRAAQEDWGPARFEAALSTARKAGNPAVRPKGCEVYPGASNGIKSMTP